MLNIAGLVLAIGIDTLINVELYRFGLQFSYEWYGPYFNYAFLLMTCLGAAIGLVAGALLAYLSIGLGDDTEWIRWSSLALLITGLGANLLAIYYFTRIDSMVHGSLYEYGLQFSGEWAVPYWSNARLMLALIGGASAIIVLAGLLVFLSARETVDV